MQTPQADTRHTIPENNSIAHVKFSLERVETTSMENVSTKNLV